MSAKIFKNEEGRARLEAWYDRFLSRVPGPVEQRDVPTLHGPSHVLIAGDPSLPTLVALHSSLTSAAHLLSEMRYFLDRLRVIAIDLPGQSARGPMTRLSLKDDSLGRWVIEILDNLGVDDFDLFAVSWGGFAGRQVAHVAPERVRRLALLVPAGIVGGSMWEGMTQMMIPMALYRMSPSEKRLRRFIEPLFTVWDDDWAHYMGDAMRFFSLDLTIPPLATEDQLRSLTMPTLMISAGKDVSFPGGKMIERVRQLIPDLEVEILAESKHCPPTTDEFRHWLADRVTAFFTSGAPA